MDVGELKRRVAEIRWYHSIDLGHGIVTPGYDQSPSRLPKIRMPADLTGMTVLDVGAWDGFFSFEAERRGAEGWGDKSGFELAREVLASGVEDKEIEVLDLSPETVGVFDLVLFLGVLYHMRHPLLALERVASVTGKQLILGTHVDLLGVARPAMAFYPGDELNHDSSNWWGPNPAAVLAMLRDVGFRRIEVVRGPYSLPLRVVRAMKWKARGRDPLIRGVCQGRMTVHAFR